MRKRGKRRVAVTGIGAVTALGGTFKDSWAGILSGRRVAGPIRAFDASRYPTRFAYEVPSGMLAELPVTQAERQLLDRIGAFGIQAAVEALSQAGIPDAGVSPGRTGLCLGVGMGGPDYDWYQALLAERALSPEMLSRHPRYWPHALGTVMARLAAARGGVTTVHTACASSGQAVGEAFEAVAYGDLDTVITGGADSMINPFHVAGFSLLGALSTRNDDPAGASRPFDADRDGFVLGEGACMLVLESWDQAEARGAAILGEIAGYGCTETAWRVTDLHPEGRGPFEAMRDAVADAGATPGMIGYLNAHGTSTALNDRCEAGAVARLFGGGGPHVSSTKSATGHLISAAGAFEAAVCVQALRDQILPPSLNLSRPDPDCPVTLCGPTAMPKSMTHALSNSVGFGGSNTAVVVRRTGGDS